MPVFPGALCFVSTLSKAASPAENTLPEAAENSSADFPARRLLRAQIPASWPSRGHEGGKQREAEGKSAARRVRKPDGLSVRASTVSPRAGPPTKLRLLTPHPEGQRTQSLCSGRRKREVWAGQAASALDWGLVGPFPMTQTNKGPAGLQAAGLHAFLEQIKTLDCSRTL